MASHAATAADLHHHDEEHPPPVVWSARTPIGLMGMLFFIGSEIALFGSFFMAYFFIRVAGEADYSSWAEQMGNALPLKVVTINSLVLFSSSVTVHYAEIALLRGARGWQAIWLALTAILGFTFLGVQIMEYGNLIGDDHLGPSNSAYSSVFFSLTGLHGSHVAVGGILLLIMLTRTLRGHYAPEADRHVGFRTMSIYWHFVDLVWVFVFGLIYVPGNIDAWGDTDVFGLPGYWTFLGGAAIILFLMFVAPKLVGKTAPKH
jgi:cytochrome c oxidase subunit 3